MGSYTMISGEHKLKSQAMPVAKQSQHTPDPAVTISIKAVMILAGALAGGGGATYLAQPARQLETKIIQIETQIQHLDMKLDRIERRILTALADDPEPPRRTAPPQRR